MSHFEVFIPAVEEAGFDLTLRIEADNWIAALKTGMSKVGLQGPGGNIFCDIKDDSIHVTDPTTQKVFRIRELTDLTGAPQTAPPAPPPQAAPPPPAPQAAPPPPPPQAAPPPPPPQAAPPPPPPQAAPPPPAPQAAPPPPPPQAAPPPPAPQAAPPPPPPQAAPPPPAPQAAPPPPPPQAAPPPPAPQAATVEPKVIEISRTKTIPGVPREVIGRPARVVDVEETLAELFMQVQDIFDYPDLPSALSFALDLAMDKVPSESGSVYRAEISTRDLFFVAARGPKADALLALNPRIPVGTGLAGFTVEEGVALAIGDAHRDPRFFKTISEKLGYECRSIITVPVQLEGQVMGAIQLINRKDGSNFCEADLSILNYLAHEIAEYLRRTGDVTV